MSEPRQPDPAVLVLGVLSTRADDRVAALALCEQEFGPVHARFGPVPFSWSKYYDGEMGSGIVREWIVFGNLVDPGRLPGLKLFTNSVEQRYATDGRRSVNLDPGLLTLWNLVLATGKPRHQRVYVGQGIFGDLTLIYHTSAYRELPWTYRDWAGPDVRELLGHARQQLLEQDSGNVRRSTNEETQA